MYRLLKIDELLRGDHHYLSEDDDCVYLMEYAPSSMDSVKSVVLNFKKPPDKAGQPDFKYKAIAIQKIAGIFQESVPPFEQPDTILVPIPPSKSKDHPLYDNRVLQLLKLFCKNRKNADIREIISVRKTLESSHVTPHRPPPEEIKLNLQLDLSQCVDKKPKIILVDDVITTGAHFKACKALLQPIFPESHISGLFIARRVLTA